jgi:hypothetical protein
MFERIFWKDRLRANPIPWLLEPDTSQPAVRYLTLRDILGRPGDEIEVKEARAAIMRDGPIPEILASQAPEGYWDKPGPGYGPKYRGTQWAIVFMAQLGVDGYHPQVRAGCEYLLSHAIARNGSLSMNGTPSGFVHCMAGNLGAALIDLGWLGDQRLDAALEWIAQAITGEGVADTTSRDTDKRYYKSGTSGPLFACAVNIGLPCAWGAIKAMLALGRIPPSLRTQRMQTAIQQGIAFLLSHDPAVADYPFGMGNKPSSSWFKFGYPLGYITDVLQNLEVLASLGHAQDPRLARALDLVVSKQDRQGRWMLEYSYNGKTWVDIEKKGEPSKWVTLRALRVLKTAYPEQEYC